MRSDMVGAAASVVVADAVAEGPNGTVVVRVSRTVCVSVRYSVKTSPAAASVGVADGAAVDSVVPAFVSDAEGRGFVVVRVSWTVCVSVRYSVKTSPGAVSVVVAEAAAAVGASVVTLSEAAVEN